MSIIGIAQRGAAVYNPYQQNKASGKGTSQEFNDSYLSERGVLAQTAYMAMNHDAAIDSEKENENDIDFHIGNMAGFKAMEIRLTPEILGFGATEDGMSFSAKYADDSTAENPMIEVRMRDKTGAEKIVKVDVKNVDPTNATQLEMLALLTHADAQSGQKAMESYNDLMHRAQNSTNGDLTSKNMQDFISWRQNWRDMRVNSSEYDMTPEEMLRKTRAAADDGVPYSYLAKDGMIDYKGVIFVCDTEHKALRLGDTSDPKKCINIGLSGGGSLIVNRDNLGDLAKAIGMFSPEDVNLILRAIAEDAKIQQMKQQIDDETSGLDIAENTGEQKTDEELSEIPLAETVLGEKQKEENDKK